MSIIKLCNSSNNNYIHLSFEKSMLSGHCNVTIKIDIGNDRQVVEKYSVRFQEIVALAKWYLNMPDSFAEYADLTIQDLNLKFCNYFFEKGDGVYNVTYTSESNKKYTLQLWEQVPNSNSFVHEQFMNVVKGFG